MFDKKLMEFFKKIIITLNYTLTPEQQPFKVKKRAQTSTNTCQSNTKTIITTTTVSGPISSTKPQAGNKRRILMILYEGFSFILV
jgi:hypothetical protein